MNIQQISTIISPKTGTIATKIFDINGNLISKTVIPGLGAKQLKMPLTASAYTGTFSHGTVESFTKSSSLNGFGFVAKKVNGKWDSPTH